MIALAWWMRAVGLLYLLMAFVILIPQVPIRAEGPPGIMDQIAAGNPVARFCVDTWIMFGPYIGVVGAALLAFSRTPETARALAFTVLTLEFFGGIGIDVHKLARLQTRAADSLDCDSFRRDCEWPAHPAPTLGYGCGAAA